MRPQVLQHTEITSGPLPSPERFQAYEKTLPGSAERLLSMAERVQEDAGVARQQSIRKAAVGQWLGYSLGLLGICGPLVLAFLEKPLWSYAAAVTPLAAVIAIFLRVARSSRQSAERQVRLPAQLGGRSVDDQR